MEIQIKCKGAIDLPLDDLLIMQGNLKELSETNYAKLHDLMISMGFDSPMQIWVNPNGGNYLLDGTQRTKVLLKLREEGYIIPNIPCDLIYADNKQDAKKRLLTKISQYGTVTEEGLYEFTNEADSIIEPDFGELLDIPGMDFTKDDIDVKSEAPSKPKEDVIVRCPHCKNEFTLEEAKLAE